jgi:DNA ligase 1
VNNLTSRIQLLAFVLMLLASASAFAKDAPDKSPGPAILLANVLSADIDVTQYLVSEKYDGVRAIWDGRVLKFRSGRVVNAPAWFIAKLPPQSLDGELWLARENFEQLSGIVRKTEPVDEEWRQLKYMIFELPDGAGTFAERAARIREIVDAAKFPQLVAVAQTPIVSRAALQQRFDKIVADGAEGLMLHLASAPYSTGRSDVLLKLKPLLDTEAKVVEHVPGKGKYKGMMGALRVEMPDGRRFNIGTGFTDSVRKNPPPVGTTITYTYPSLTKSGLPRFASYLRVRETF